MTKYRVFFTSGQTIDISEEALRELATSMIEAPNIHQVCKDPTTGQGYWFNTNHITHMVEIETLSPEDGVVSPPEPQTLKSEEEERKRQQVSSLENVLSHRGEDES
jgi:hypothetical protein